MSSDDEIEVPEGPAAARVIPWLRCNLGREVVAALTGTDCDAVMAAAQLAELYQRVRQDKNSLAIVRLMAGNESAQRHAADSYNVALAFKACVLVMQPKCREMAYHAIAMVGNWSDRALWWGEAGLDPIEKPMRCKYDRKG
jgi:hypothetical protein